MRFATAGRARRRRVALAGGAIALAAGAALHARDLRAIRRDPLHERLMRPLEGRPLAVRSADGTELHVEAFGPPDGDPIVLIHGWMCALRFWTVQIQRLSRRHRVIAYDLRGHGRSGRPANGDYSAPALAADFDAVLQATLGEGERALAVGHSLGAMTIAAWVAEHAAEVPARLRAAVLANTGISELSTSTRVVTLPPPFERLGVAVATALLASRMPYGPPSPITFRSVRHSALSPAASPAQVAFCQEQILSCRADTRAALAETMTALDLRDAVAGLTVPVVVIAGSRDRLTPPVHARRLAELLPAAEVAELDSGHMGPVEAPDAVSDTIERLARRAVSAPV